MPIVVSEIGLKAIADADAGGFQVNLASFAVTQALNVKPKITDEALAEAPVYSAKVQSIEVVSGSKIKVTLYIPANIPREGSWRLTELGLYLKTGELFVHGTFKIPYEKTNEFGLKVIVFVSASRLGSVINVTLGTNSSLASTANVRTLIEPSESETNAIIVQDGSDADSNVAAPTFGALALRYGAGGSNWAFTGHDLSYRGHPTVVKNNDEFELNAEVEGGFWLSHNETVIVQVVAGAGSGESRRVRYDRPYGTFHVLETPFTNLDEQSIIHIWRSTKNQLPERLDTTPRHYVLGMGVNTWKREEIIDPHARKDLIPNRVALKSDGVSNEYNLPSRVPDAVFLNKDNFVVFAAGKMLPMELYSVTRANGVTIFGDPLEAGTAVEIFYYEEVESKGSSLTFAVAEYEGDGVTWTFNTSIIPPTANHLMVFVGGLYVSKDDYLFTGSSVTFTKAAPTGSVCLVLCANFDEIGAGTSIIRKEAALQFTDNVANPIQLNARYLEKKNTIVSIEGKRLDFQKYDIVEGELFVREPFPESTPVSIVGFSNEVDAVLIQEYSGANTGPEWIDPAGRYVKPNKVIAKKVSYVGNGVTSSYEMETHGTAALVFVDGVFQNPKTLVINSIEGLIDFPQPSAVNSEIDIISFQELESEGEKIVCERHAFVVDPESNEYFFDAPEEGKTRQVTLVSMGGVYQHESSYVITDNSITFTGTLKAGEKVELWHFVSIPQPGHSNAISYAYHVLSRAKTEYVHSYYDNLPIDDAGEENNTLLFADTVLQYNEAYTVTNTDSYVFNIPEVEAEEGQQALSIVFYTGESKTRLITRDEMRSRYITRAEVMKLALGTGGVVTPPGGGSGGTDPDPDPTPTTGAKVVFLSASSMIFKVANDGAGEPQSIVFTANPQNVTGNVVFSVLFGDATISTLANTATLAYADMRTDAVTVRARVTEEISGASYFDDVTIVKLHEGRDAITAILTNESHTLPADSNGVVTSYTGASTSIEMYRGTLKETSSWTFERNNSAGVKSTISGNTITVTEIAGVANGYIDITAYRDGFSPIVKRFSLSLSKTGVSAAGGSAGVSAITAMLTTEAFIFAADFEGNVTDFSQASTKIKIYSGQTDDTSKWILTRANSTGVSSTLIGNELYVTAFSAQNDTGSVTITAKRSGYPDLVKTFVLSKAKGTTGSGNTGTAGPAGKRGSMHFYIPNRTSWSDAAADSATISLGGEKILTDEVTQYSNTTGFAESRFWNGSAWVVIQQVIPGSVLVRGSVGAEALAARIIKANSGLIDDLAIGTLMIGGNAVTQASAVKQRDKTQMVISTTGPIAVDNDLADPSNVVSVISIVVSVTGTQPVLVWGNFSAPNAKEVSSGTQGAYKYWDKWWLTGASQTEVCSNFTLKGVNNGLVYKAGFLSTSIPGGGTVTVAASGIFEKVTAGNYVLSMNVCKAASTLADFSIRGAGMVALETKK